MKLKNSLVNRAYLESLIKRYSWVSLLVTGLFLFNAILSILSYASYGLDGGLNMIAFFVLSFVLIFTIPLMLFKNTSSSSVSSHMFSLPITRMEYFITTYLSGLVLVGLPVLVMFTWVSLTEGYMYRYYEVGRLFTMTLLLFFSYYNFSILACQIAGKSRARGAINLALCILPSAIYGFYNLTVTIFSITKTSNYVFQNFDWMKYSSPLFYGISYWMSYSDNWIMFLHIAIGIGVLLLSYIIFTKKNYENSEEMINHLGIRTGFKYISISSVSLILFYLTYLVVDFNNFSMVNKIKLYFLFSVCFVVCSIIFELLYNKQISFKKMILPIVGVYTFIMVATNIQAYHYDHNFETIHSGEYYSLKMHESYMGSGYLYPSYETYNLNTDDNIDDLTLDFLKEILKHPE